MTIETEVLEIIHGKKNAPLTKGLLRVMSECYKTGVSLRHFLYDWIIPQTKFSRPVISIGNIVAGGTGKTPFVHFLSKTLGEDKVAILTRGYRRKGKKTLVIEDSHTPEECGDEPYLLAKKLPKAQVIVGTDRAFSAHLAQVLDAKYILLDDGMQYLPIEKTMEIVMIDANDPFGMGYYLPRGLLRDNPKRLAKANLIVLNHVKDETHYEEMKKKIAPFSKAPLTALRLDIENHVSLSSKKVASFCAIAKPERFIHTLKQIGCDVVLDKRKGDHLPFTSNELQQLANQAVKKGAECLVCTEKDAVKIPENLPLSLPIIPVKISFTPTFGKENLEQLIQEVQYE